MAMPPKIYLDGYEYYVEKGSYSQSAKKVYSQSMSLTTQTKRSETGMRPDSWSMTIVCMTQQELFNISGSFVKISSDSRLPYSGLRSDAHMIYFDSMGPAVAVDKAQTIFRVPIKLGSSEVGQ